jgi:hypothetical protein
MPLRSFTPIRTRIIVDSTITTWGNTKFSFTSFFVLIFELIGQLILNIFTITIDSSEEQFAENTKQDGLRICCD